MKKLFKNLLAFLLVITLALQLGVFATAQGNKATDDGTDIVYEIPEFRGEFEKHFQMADGTVVASTYAEPVNYYDSTDNTWKEIDNTLTQEDGRYKNKGHGGFNVSFRGDGTSGDLVEMSDGGYTLSWSVSVQNEYGEKNGLKQQVNASVKQRENTEKDRFAADKAGSGMRYNSPFGGNKIINVDYTVSQHKVKEDITIYSKKDANVVYYTYNCPSLTAVLTEDNSILFVNSANETVFTVHTPYMYDSAGNGSYGFDISLQQRGDICTVVMTPDKDWLSSPDRVYPVVIDPTVTNSKTVDNYDDTYIYEGDTAGANYLNEKMYIGLRNGVQNYALLKINGLPSIPSNATLIKAELVLTMLSGSTTGGPFTLWHLMDDVWTELSARAVIPATDLWAEETVCYANRPSIGSSIASNVEANFGDLNLTFDITTYYNRVVSGTYDNNGFQIGYTDTSVNDYNAVYTSNCGNTASFPLMQVVYTPAAESESNNTMSTADEIELLPYPGTVTSVTGTHTSSGTTVDYDYFKFTAPRHGRVEVTLKVNGGGFGITYYLATYDQSGALLASDSVLTYSDGSGTYSGYTDVNFTATKDGNSDGSLDTYYIRVYGTAGSTAPYNVTVKYTTQYASLGWNYPLSTTTSVVNDPVTGRTSSYHQGMDIDAAFNAPLKAPTTATVFLLYYNPSGQKPSDYTTSGGNYITLRTTTSVDVFNDNNKFHITYMHMNSPNVDLKIGDSVNQTTVVGYVGSTGVSSGNHLHLEIYSNDGSRYFINAPSPEATINPFEIYYSTITFTGTPY